MLWIIFGVTLGTFIYYNIIKPSHYWDDYDIVHVSSWPLVGNMLDFVLRKKHFSEVAGDLYRKFTKERYVGYMQFQTPALLLRDIELIKQVGIKDFENFHDHTGFAVNELDSLLGKSLINLKADKWKQMRATLSPAFTSSKLKNMYSLMWKCSENMVKYFEEKHGATVEMKDVFTRYANDVIASIAFGIEIDSVNDPNNEFYEMGKKLTVFTAAKALKVFMLQSSSLIAKIFNIKLLDQDISKFFRSIISNNIEKRTKEHIVRHDLIHLLMEARKGQLKHEASEDKQAGFASVEESNIGKNTKQMTLTHDHMIAQALIFFFAGFDTISTVSCFVAYELAVNPEIQKNLQEEIDSVINQFPEGVSYEALLSMKYLDQVVSETLRMWPPAFQTDRLCTENITIEPKNANEKRLNLKKGATVIIPILALHHDDRYFPNPKIFDPDRFNDENKSKIVPGTYLPFGIGPRNCIGSRLALLELKTLFFSLLSKFDIVVTEKTEVPIKISPAKPILFSENGIHLAFKLRNSTA